MSRLESGFLWYGASLDTSAFRGFASMYGCKTSKFTEETMRCTYLCMTLLVFIQLFKTSDDDVFRAGWMGCICIVLYCGDGWPRDVEPVQATLLQSSCQPPCNQIWRADQKTSPHVTGFLDHPLFSCVPFFYLSVK